MDTQSQKGKIIVYMSLTIALLLVIAISFIFNKQADIPEVLVQDEQQDERQVVTPTKVVNNNPLIEFVGKIISIENNEITLARQVIAPQNNKQLGTEIEKIIFDADTRFLGLAFNNEIKKFVDKTAPENLKDTAPPEVFIESTAQSSDLTAGLNVIIKTLEDAREGGLLKASIIKILPTSFNVNPGENNSGQTI